MSSKGATGEPWDHNFFEAYTRHPGFEKLSGFFSIKILTLKIKINSAANIFQFNDRLSVKFKEVWLQNERRDRFLVKWYFSCF